MAFRRAEREGDYGMSEHGAQQPSVQTRALRPRRRSFLGWVGFTIVVTMLSTMISGYLVYRTSFLRVPAVAEALCGKGQHIEFFITKYIVPETGMEVEDKQVACISAEGMRTDHSANLAMLKLWLLCALIIGGLLHTGLVWRARWELKRLEREYKAAAEKAKS